MSNKWQSRNEIGGILRKGNSTSSNPEARTVDLLVFGYACKIFRDDAKAREIDQGKHLIPWMGDANLKIDRYDVRGALYDLTPYEPPPGGYGNRLDYLTSEEQRAEQLCEEERYLYLYRNEQEEILYQEEELKRLQQESGSDSTYNQVQFNYDMPLGPNRDENSSELGPDNEADKAFSLPKNFEVPPSIQLPETMKQHAIIEKTARFISAQGPQMEILIKAKQSNNQQFDFLTQNNPLNVYYKFVLSALKSGTYPEPEAETPDPLPEDNSNTTANNNSFEDPFSKPYIPVPTIKYTPSANCAYTQLISKIKGVPLPPPEPEKQQQSIYTPVLLQQNAAHSAENGDAAAAAVGAAAGIKTASKVELKNVPNALMLAHYYSSDTENEGDQSDEEEDKEAKEKEKEFEPELCFPIPPDYLQNIIDKTAGYVIKNGRQFEETLRIKNDERFTFLFPDSEFYSYYMYKVTGEVKSYAPSEEDEDKQKVASGPVSFSIKTKDEQPVSVIRPALPQEASDDESENKVKSNGTHVGEQGQLPQQQQQPSRTVPEHVQKAIQLVESQLMARNAQLGIPTVQNRTRFDIDHTGTMAPKLPTTPSVLIAVEEPPVKLVNNHQKELKRAEEKVKDKLAQIAREKLGGLLSKEKQLQIERKKKAMAFLNQIKGATQSIVSDKATKFLTKSATDAKDADDSDTSSVHSIPISSYGDDKSDTELGNNPSNNNEHKEDAPIDADADDDDDVQLITVEPKRRHSRSRTRPFTQTPEVVIISPKRSRSISRHSVKRSKSKSHKSKKKSSKRSHHSKKKSKKRSRSHSTHRSRSYYSDEEEEVYSSSDSSSRKRRKRSSSHKKKKSRRHDR